MPKIDIKERDLTTAGGLNGSSNVVYVPGFAIKKYLNPKYKLISSHNSVGESVLEDTSYTKPKKEITFPYLFNSVAEFKEIFTHPTTSGDSFELFPISGETGVEKSQLYALSILQQGLPVLFDPVLYDNECNKSEYQAAIESKLSSLDYLKDRNNYDIKFLTSGGYYSATFGGTLISIAAARGDCTAIIDHSEKTVALDMETDSGEIPNSADGKYGAMFTPWCTFQFPKWDSKKNTPLTSMPGSLAYLLAFASSINANNANWLAAAGASRGGIPYLEAPLVVLSEDNVAKYQRTNNNVGISINPITNINPYGVIVWGNRTLNPNASGLIASSFLNIRQLCNDIKKTLYIACKSITFEQNSDLLWVKFKSMITPLLDQMQTGDGISGYQISKKKSTKKATLTAVIRIYPIEAVEDFDITLELADEDTTVSDNL